MSGSTKPPQKPTIESLEATNVSGELTIRLAVNQARDPDYVYRRLCESTSRPARILVDLSDKTEMERDTYFARLMDKVFQNIWLKAAVLKEDADLRTVTFINGCLIRLMG